MENIIISITATIWNIMNQNEPRHRKLSTSVVIEIKYIDKARV